jgi:hypothetical protein
VVATVVAILAEAVVLLDAPEWVLGAVATGAVAIGMAETGAVPGMDAIGGIRTANGVGGMATGGVMPSLTLYSLAILAFRGGGVGAGVRGRAGDILTDITAMAIRIMATRITATVMDIPAMGMVNTVTGTVTAKAANTALLLAQEWLSYSADLPVPAIIEAQSMESWGLRRAEQFGPTRRSTGT